MKPRELSLKEKQACIFTMIAILISGAEEFICHCFSEFVQTKTDMEASKNDTPENFMHIIFPELYNGLKSLVDDDTYMEKYNKNDSRMGDDFDESHKCPVWYHQERDERIHFLNDLNETLK